MADQVEAAPYLRWGWTALSDDDDEIEIGGLLIGANVVWAAQPDLDVLFGLAWELQNWDVDFEGFAADDSGNGFSITVGVEYSFK